MSAEKLLNKIRNKKISNLIKQKTKLLKIFSFSKETTEKRIHIIKIKVTN